MKKLMIYFCFVFCILFLVLFVNFSLTSNVIDSLNSNNFVNVTRHLPLSYNLNEPFYVVLNFDFNDNLYVDGSLFFAEVVEGGVISFVESSDSVFFEGDTLFWKDLEFIDQNISYQVVSSSSLINFSGKWGLNVSLDSSCPNCEGDIFGDSSLIFFGSEGDFFEGNLRGSSGRNPGGGGGTFLPNFGENISGEEIIGNFQNVSLNHSNFSKDSQSSQLKEEIFKSNSFWWFFVIFFTILILGIGIIIYLKIKKQREIFYSSV